jgi:hypothetical protein
MQTMPAWFDGLRRKRSAVSRLAQQLQSYPAYAAPHAGPPSGWTLEQAQRNLQYLLDHLEQRLAAIGSLLRCEGIDVQPALAGGDAAPLLLALQRWALEQWPSIRRPHLTSRDAWLRSTRAGDDIAYSMLMDLAILLGELIVRRRPTIGWGLDLDEVNGRDGMVSFLRPVLLAPRHGLAPEPLDVEAIVVGRLRNIESPSEALVDNWAQVVHDAVSGAYERVY